MRLLVSLLAITGLMTLPAAYAAGRVRTVRALVLEIRTDAARGANTVGLLRRGVSDLDRLERAYVATADPELAGAVALAVERIEEQAASLRGLGYVNALDASGLPLEQLRAMADSIHTLVAAGELSAATGHLATTATPLLHQSDEAVAYLAGAIDRKTQFAAEEANGIADAAAATTVAAIFASLLLALALAWLAARVLSQPLERLGKAMRRVADGQFAPPADEGYDRRDEVGDLFRSFRSMAARLAELDRLKAELVGGASHDLKTPVSVVAGYAELLEEELAGSLRPRQQRLLSRLMEQTRTLSHRANHLLEISRLEASGVRAGLEEINIRHFSRGIEQRFGPIAADRQILLSVETGASAPALMVADPDSLREEVLGHLLEDAFAFTPAGGRVEVAFHSDGGSLVIDVSDGGPTICNGEAPFFFQRDGAGLRDATEAAPGVGLAIAWGATAAHGGTIVAAPDGAGGPSYRVVLPLRPTVGSRPASDTATPEGRAGVASRPGEVGGAPAARASASATSGDDASGWD